MKSERDLALESCDNAFIDGMHKITAILMDGRASATDDQMKTQCRIRYEARMRTCQQAYRINREVVDQVFPQ
jgi:hypothetical protein